MATIAWPGAPAFYAGQVMSASAHLNRLARCINYLYGITGVAAAPLSAFELVGYHRNSYIFWEGEVRHKSDTLSVSFVTNGQSFRLRIRIDEVLVSTGADTMYAAGSIHTVDVDISGAGLAADQFYHLKVEAYDEPVGGDHCEACYILAIDVAETLDISGVLPTLAAFDDGDVPTAAEWQGLSDYADALHSTAIAPVVPIPSLWGKSVFVDGLGDPVLTDLFHGGSIHYARYLLYQVQRRTSRTTYDIHVRINGLTQATIDDATMPRTASESELGPTGYWVYTGSIDLEALGLTIGELYEIAVEGNEGEDPYELYANGILDYLYESATPVGLSGGWVTPPTWEAHDYVTGDSGAKPVQQLRDDLISLGTNIAFRNRGTHIRYGKAIDSHGTTIFSSGYWFIHAHQWLHYNVEDSSATLVYFFNGWKSVPLSADDPDGTWVSFDLSAQEGLIPGMIYLVRGVNYAIEDVNQ
jgi:hypothetical protein